MEKQNGNKYVNSGLHLNNINSKTIPSVSRETLSTKKAVELLLEGTLRKKVCRYCLSVTSQLSELDQVLQIAGKETLYKVTIRDMIACFHPYMAADDPNFPTKICNRCVNRTISCYLFSQQCERSERALRNCFDDVYDKFEKLDPIERPKKRGRQKLNPNYNIIYAEHEKVIDYAEPIINIVNIESTLTHNEEPVYNELECARCWRILPNVESLLNHEKIHPKTMWYHCRLCGKSFAKRNQLKKHFKTTHTLGNELALPTNVSTDVKCKECGHVNKYYHQHLQHLEKHKFKMVLQHLIDRNMDRLCAICLDKGVDMVELEKIIYLHGGYPELSGSRSLYSILSSTLPDMNFLLNYTGTKVCEKCFRNAITSYVFKNQSHCVRTRLNTCVSLMLDNLNQVVEPNGNIVVEISQNIILPDREQDYIDEDSLPDENDDVDESKLKVDVLEDEFRIESDSEESDFEPKLTVSNIKTYKIKKAEVDRTLYEETIDNPAKNVTKTYANRKLVNGLQTKFVANDTSYNNLDVCSEFLTFKKRRKPSTRVYNGKFTCPLCSKYFINGYHLKRHILKHVNRKVKCATCSDLFISKFSLHEHIKMVHLLNRNSYSSCNICGRTFVDANKLKCHERTHVTKQCHLCDKMFMSQKHFDSHMQRHAVKFDFLKREGSQTCSFCEKECPDDNKLSVHVNKVHLQIKPYSCDMCEKQFYTESNLNNHKIVHRMLSREKCAFCNKTLKSRRDLVVHVRKHIGVKPFNCRICGLSFYSEFNVNRHMVKNHGGKFYCKLCKNVFANKNRLKDHVNKDHNI